MPQVSRGILEKYPEFNGKIAMHEPDQAISKGAAFYSRMGDSGTGPTPISEALSCTFGVEVMDSENNDYHYCDNLLFKNDPIPNYVKKRYFIDPPYKNVGIAVLMNHCRDRETQPHEELDRCVVLREFTLELPEPAKKQEEVYVTFEINVEGILTATAQWNNVSSKCEVKIKDVNPRPSN